MKLTLVLVCSALIATSSSSISSKEADTQTANQPTHHIHSYDAEPHTAPWMVILKLGVTFLKQHCGGSIISPDWVLTAAQCITHNIIISGTLVMIAGRYNIAFHEERTTEQRRTISIRNIFGHSEYNPETLANNIGLIRANPAFTFNEYVQPISLPVADSRPSGLVVLHGWGLVSIATDNNLQTIYLPIVTFHQCQALLPVKSVPTHMCAGSVPDVAAGVMICNADQGSPLTQGNFIVGIVSFWGFCGNETPTMLAPVGAFAKWIYKVMWDERFTV